MKFMNLLYDGVAVSVLTVMIIFSPAISFAASDNLSLDRIVESVQKTFDNTRSFTAEFKQMSTVKALKRERVSSGYVYMKKSGKMRWEYKEPDEQYIISDGRVYWFYIPEDMQVMKKEISPASDPSSPAVFLTGEGVLSKIFKISLSENRKGKADTIYLKLVPVNAQPNLSELILGVNRESFRVTESIVYDYYGNTTKIILTDRVINSDIDESLFSFIPPDGVRVITE